MAEAVLTQRQRDILRHGLAPFTDRIERVGLFGSRATGKARLNSDIDLVVYGTVTQADIDRLRTLFQESSLEVGVDICAYHLIEHEALRHHIDQFMSGLFISEHAILKDAS